MTRWVVLTGTGRRKAWDVQGEPTPEAAVARVRRACLANGGRQEHRRLRAVRWQDAATSLRLAAQPLPWSDSVLEAELLLRRLVSLAMRHPAEVRAALERLV